MKVMANVLDCGFDVSEVNLRSRYYVYFQNNTFRKGMNPLIPSVMGSIIPLLFFNKNGFDIK